MVEQYNITLPEFSRGFHLITGFVLEPFKKLPDKGLLHVFIKHTSAGLTLNENADPAVRQDFESAFNNIVRENEPYYTHVLEGSDDMPAHIKSSLVGASVMVPITNGHPELGTWQGIYLCEFRNRGGRRELTVTLYS